MFADRVRVSLANEPYLRMLYQLAGQFRSAKIPDCSVGGVTP